jgi:hypothetical protein
VEGAERVVGAASGPKAIRAVQKVLFVDGLQQLAQGVLDEFVLERRDAQRARLTFSFGDVDPSDRLMAVAFRLQPLEQFLQVAQQVLPVVLLGDPIHAYRRIRTEAVIGP